MGPDHSGDFRLLDGIPGARLVGLARDQYLFNGRPSGEDGSLELRLDDGRVVLLYLAGDGESVRAAASPLKLTPSFKLEGGATCDWQLVDLGRAPGFGQLIGRAIVGVDAIIDAWPPPVSAQVVSGWRVRFAGGDFIAYVNWGDDAKMLLNELPAHTDASYRTRIEAVGECLKRA